MACILVVLHAIYPVQDRDRLKTEPILVTIVLLKNYSPVIALIRTLIRPVITLFFSVQDRPLSRDFSKALLCA